MHALVPRTVSLGLCPSRSDPFLTWYSWVNIPAIPCRNRWLSGHTHTWSSLSWVTQHPPFWGEWENAVWHLSAATHCWSAGVWVWRWSEEKGLVGHLIYWDTLRELYWSSVCIFWLSSHLFVSLLPVSQGVFSPVIFLPDDDVPCTPAHLCLFNLMLRFWVIENLSISKICTNFQYCPLTE